MALFFFPLSYLTLRDEKNRPMWRRELPATVLLACLIAGPFVAVYDTNFFGSDGFLSNMMNLSSALAGFYVAALVAAATLSHGTDLDSRIEVGQILRITSGQPDKLSRREYVCALFGYLSFLSFALAIVLNMSTSIAASTMLKAALSNPLWNGWKITYFDAVSIIAKIMISLPIAHLFIVTSFGLYYLIKRLYERKPTIIGRPRKDDRAA
ncbi:hypothetical protein ACU8MP_14615 [Rhizobium leguminosarum]